MEKPDYVKNFAQPANTEIKFICGYWYLYERSSVYDPQLGRSRKISGKNLGSIMEASRNKDWFPARHAGNG